ncbi:MAG: MobF family relaxase [Candidatus Hydrogenedentes bacterium]|nr:MobF family relaxase [Candidatus Hydrogenedentota bacterium]
MNKTNCAYVSVIVTWGTEVTTVLRFRDCKNASQGYFYFKKSDGGLEADGLHNEVGGAAAKMLGLEEKPDFDQFRNLLLGLDPHSGEQLTARIVDERIAYCDITASIPKGITIALEGGDERIHDAIWQAGREAMGDLEGMITTRMKGGRDGEKITGNMVWYGFEHPETRPAREDRMPDPDRHIHFVIPNVTWDADEQQWKAIRFRPIWELRKYFDRRFDMRLASKLSDLGYEVGTKYKTDERGGRRYYSWDIKDIPQSAVAKFSRRTSEVEKLADTLGIENPMSKDKLGATSRLHKRDDMTLADYRDYWNGRLTDDERKGIAEAIEAAKLGKHPKPMNRIEAAVDFALQHNFYRNSVVDWHDVAITAMERSMGAGLPDEVMPEAMRQGLLVKGDESTTQDVLEQEGRIIAFARDGRGTMRGLGRDDPKHVASATGTLSLEQQVVCKHIWDSPDRVIMIEGDAGTGKTTTMQRTIPGIDKPGVFLAPSASASRGTLREKGFENADTIARFLVDDRFRAQARDGYIYIDEAPLASLNDIDQVFAHAKALNARVILQGDRKQHKSIQRGNLFPVLEKFGGLPVGRLKENRRQINAKYKDAVNAIAAGDILAGYDKLAGLGWVKEGDGDHSGLVNEYMRALHSGQSVLVVSPTHKEGDKVTEAIRDKLKLEGRLGDDEGDFQILRPLHWTEAEKSDRDSYDGTEVIQFNRNSGDYRAGERLISEDVRNTWDALRPEHFSPYAPGSIKLASGDTIRITRTGKSVDGHRLDNGMQYKVKSFTKDGDIELDNGWVIGKDFKHLTHGYVDTSYSSQGKTVDVVLAAMGRDSIPAMNAEQFYVTASRGRDAFKMFTDIPVAVMRERISQYEKRKSASELFAPKRKERWRDKAAWAMRRMKRAYNQLRDKASHAIGMTGREYGYERL